MKNLFSIFFCITLLPFALWSQKTPLSQKVYQQALFSPKNANVPSFFKEKIAAQKATYLHTVSQNRQKAAVKVKLADSTVIYEGNTKNWTRIGRSILSYNSKGSVTDSIFKDTLQRITHKSLNTYSQDNLLVLSIRQELNENDVLANQFKDSIAYTNTKKFQKITTFEWDTTNKDWKPFFEQGFTYDAQDREKTITFSIRDSTDTKFVPFFRGEATYLNNTNKIPSVLLNYITDFFKPDALYLYSKDTLTLNNTSDLILREETFAYDSTTKKFSPAFLVEVEYNAKKLKTKEAYSVVNQLGTYELVGQNEFSYNSFDLLTEELELEVSEPLTERNKMALDSISRERYTYNSDKLIDRYTLEFYEEMQFENAEREDFFYSFYDVISKIDNAIESQMQVFPNPARDEIIISHLTQSAKASIYDLQGRLIQQENNLQALSNNSINITGLSNGIYYLYIQTSAGATTRKIVKE